MSKDMKKEDLSPNSSTIIDGIRIDTCKKEIISANILEVEVGTTGYQGGDTGHGCRTYFRISDLGSTDMRYRVSSHSSEGTKQDDYASSIEISFGGDCELSTFYKALQIGYEVLSQYVSGLDENNIKVQ